MSCSLFPFTGYFCHPSASGFHAYFHPALCAGIDGNMLIVFTVMVSIDAVTEYLPGVIPGREARKICLECACIPVCHRGKVPRFIFPAGNYYIVTCFRRKYPGLIPCDRYPGYE